MSIEIERTPNPAWRIRLLDFLAAPAILWLSLICRIVPTASFTLTVTASADQ